LRVAAVAGQAVSASNAASTRAIARIKPPVSGG
jgi:hypothetical protein